MQRSKVSRRDLLFGRRNHSEAAKKSIQHFLPWATNQSIESFCTGCGDCVSKCPESIISLTGSHLASVDFSLGECVFCGECADVCQTNVFLAKPERAINLPWQGQPEISEICLPYKGVVCEICKDQCPEGAIRFPPKLGSVAEPIIHEMSCTACGACVGPCPVSAIQILFNEVDAFSEQKFIKEEV